MDRFTALQVFRHVAELKSFAEAGRRLNLSPAAISKNIAELEAHVGARLINRTTRRMSLTEEGRLYLEHVIRGLDAFSEADQALRPIKQEPGGALKVTAPMSATLIFLARAIPQFLSRYPALTLDLHLDDRRMDLIKEGFDLAIRGSDKIEDFEPDRQKARGHAACALRGTRLFRRTWQAEDPGRPQGS